MNRDEFLEAFIDVLQTDEEVTFDTELSSLEEWDSLAIMSTMVFLDKNFSLKLPLSDYKKFKTVNEIAERVGL